MSCRLVSHLTGSPNRITPARFFLRAVWKLTASKSYSLTKPLLCWAAVANSASRGSSLHPVHHWSQILVRNTGKSCFFIQLFPAVRLHPLNLLPRADSTSLAPIPAVLPCSQFCLLLMYKHRPLLTFYSGEASGWRRLPEKKKGRLD